MTKEQEVRPATPEEERELDSVLENGADSVDVRGRKWTVRWIRKGTLRKVSHIQLQEKDELKVTTKCVAALRLNGFFRIALFYWIVWRWYYYVKEYNDAEMIPFIELCKKKVPLIAYCEATLLLNGMRDTIKVMTREEVSRILRGNATERPGASEKSITT